MKKTIYCDASYDWKYTDMTTEDKIRGKIAVVSDDHQHQFIKRILLKKTENLKQYINILELCAIIESIKLAISNNWNEDILICSDSYVAVAWAKKNKIKNKVRTDVHANILNHLARAKIQYGNKIEFMQISRNFNPAGFLLEEELKRANPYD